MELFLFTEISRRWGYWGHIRNGKKKQSYLRSAPTLVHHTLQSMQTALTRTCGKTRGKKKHLQTHTPALSLCSVGSQQEPLSLRLFFPPFFSSFLPGSHVCLALPSVLHAVEHRAASGCRTSTRWQECLVEFCKKWKTWGKVSRSESGCGFESSGTVKLFSDSCFDFEICDFVCPSFESGKWT